MRDMITIQKMPPSLFIGHGSPTLVMDDVPARNFLRELGPVLPAVKGVLVVSAHWRADALRLTSSPELETIHDFHGFPDELYEIAYPAKTAPWLLQAAEEALRNSGHEVTADDQWGLDHGAWVPLSLMYPETDKPMAQLTLLEKASPEELFNIGQALAPLRQQGVLVIGSGGAVHNLKTIDLDNGPTPDWAGAFDDWLYEKLNTRDLGALFDILNTAPHVDQAHPTTEHLLPLFVAMGAGWHEGTTQRIHHSFTYGSLSMANYSFG